APQIDRDHRHDLGADFAAGHDDADLAVGTAQYVRHGIARARELEIRVDLADAGLLHLGAVQDFADLNLPRTHRGARLDRILAAVEADVRGDAAARGVEIERIEAEHRVLHLDVRLDVAQRQRYRALQRAGAQYDVGIHRAPTLGVEGLVGENLAARLARHVALRALRRARARADRRPEVGDVEQLRAHLAVQER